MMEIFWIIIPFIGIFLIARGIYRKYKYAEEEAKCILFSWLKKYSWYRYFILITDERVALRQSTLIWRIIFWLALLIGSATMYIYILEEYESPPLPLEKMKTEIGIVKSISFNRRVSDSIYLQTTDNKEKKFRLSIIKKTAEKILNKKVKVYYLYGWSSAFTKDNIIYEIILDNMKIKNYNYNRTLDINKSFLKFSKNSYYVAFFALFMLWVFNRKELPIHRLNRMRQFKKNREKK